MCCVTGQAYVALSRIKRLSQLHLWGLERQAIKASAAVTAQYALMRRAWTLDRAFIDSVAPRRVRVRSLLPLAAP